jgi:AcrR family transcriptional regulator
MMPKVKRGPGRPPDAALQELRREQILEAATGVFAECSYRNTDLQCIADFLKLSKASIYRYFPSKEELFFAAVDRGISRLDEYINQHSSAEPDPLVRLARAIEAYLAYWHANPQIVELLIQERAEFKDRKQSTYFVHKEKCLAPWREIYLNLMAEGRVRRMPVDRILEVVSDLLYGAMFTNHFTGRAKPHAEQAQDIVDIVFRGILADAEQKRRAAR